MSTSCGWEGKGRYGSFQCEWTCGCAGKTVRSLENTCHTWALLRWLFTTKRCYIKCMYLYLLPLPICYVWSCSTYTQAQPTALSSIWICNRLCASLWQLDVSIKYFVGQLKMHFFHLDCSTQRLLYVCWYKRKSYSVLKLWKKKWRNARSEAPKAPRRTPKAWESRRRRRRGGRGMGRGCPPPQPTRGSGGASWAPPAGSGAEPRPKTNLVHFVVARRTLMQLFA